MSKILLIIMLLSFPAYAGQNGDNSCQGNCPSENGNLESISSSTSESISSSTSGDSSSSAVSGDSTSTATSGGSTSSSTVTFKDEKQAPSIGGPAVAISKNLDCQKGESFGISSVIGGINRGYVKEDKECKALKKYFFYKDMGLLVQAAKAYCSYEPFVSDFESKEECLSLMGPQEQVKTVPEVPTLASNDPVLLAQNSDEDWGYVYEQQKQLIEDFKQDSRELEEVKQELRSAQYEIEQSRKAREARKEALAALLEEK